MPKKNALQKMAEKGGLARAAKLDKSRRAEIARDAANTRWDGQRKHAAATGCKCCGVAPPAPTRGDRPFWCEDCRKHRSGVGADRTYRAAHGEPCPFTGVALDKRKPAKHRHDFRDGDVCSGCDALKAS